MANVNSVSNSYSSSIYGSRNVLSGLASGLDTEAMIENSVSGYKTKITQLQQQMESLTWKQDAYRGITDKMIALLDKYTSYTSKTNLTSSSYFTKAVKNVISGTFASKISATGSTSSDVQIKEVTQLATAAKATADFSGKVSATGGEITWDKMVPVSDIAGSSMTIDVQGRSVELNFDENDVYASLDKMVEGINKKLDAQGADNVRATVGEDGSIKFTAGEEEYSITEVTGKLADIAKKGEDGTYTIDKDAESKLSTEQDMVTYLSGKSINVEYNGTTKKISLAELTNNVGEGITNTEALAKTIQDEVNKAFGTNKMNVSVNDEGGLSFDDNGTHSTLKVTSDAGELLGIGNGVSNYIDTNKTLGELLNKSDFVDENGEPVTKDFVINGVKIGSYGADTKLSDILSDINNSKAGVKASFSSLTNEFVFTATETGSGHEITFGDDKNDLASKLFGDTVTESVDGKDAILTATINGKDVTMTRSSNTVDIDGLSVTLKGTFKTVEGADQEPVTIKTTTDSDNIVNDIKSFVEEYNALLKEIHDAYSTQPLYDSSGKKYSALTEDDKSGMSDNAIAKYEEKAKTGLLFGDSDLSSLYTKMTSIVTSALSGIGITATYSQSDGLTQISLDEDKLRDVLEKDPDKVRDAFTSSKALGNSSDGLMTKVKDLFNTYASKSIGSPGILVNKAGTKLSSYSLTHNEVQKQIDQLQEKIDGWQTKLNKKIDYYTRQFTTLEKLMNTMNNQSSALSGLMGGY